jgi:hypothetical protein
VNVRRSRSVLALAAGALVLTACGNSAPPAAELAEEMIDTLEVDGVPVSDDVKTCMKAELDGFQLTEEEAQGFTDLDDVAQKAADGQAQALQIMGRFEESLASCNVAG